MKKAFAFIIIAAAIVAASTLNVKIEIHGWKAFNLALIHLNYRPQAF